MDWEKEKKIKGQEAIKTDKQRNVIRQASSKSNKSRLGLVARPCKRTQEVVGYDVVRLSSEKRKLKPESGRLQTRCGE